MVCPVTADIAVRGGRWRLLGAVAIMVVTALVVVVSRGTGNAQAPAPAAAASVAATAGAALPGLTPAPITDTAFLQLMISMDDSAIALFVALQSESVLLRDLAGQLVESHGAELYDLRVLLAGRGVVENASGTQGLSLPGFITPEDLVTVSQTAPADRDRVAIEFIYQHLTESARLAANQRRTGTTFAATALAVRIEDTRAAQLALLTTLPTIVLA